MQGDFPDKGLWENKAPDWADELAIARIDVLERQGRTQEAAYLVEAEAHERRHGASLWRLGRIEKETLIAFRQVRTEESAMALAKQMIELGAIPYGLRMATDVLEFPGEPYQLAAWMRDKALAGGDVDWAIRATEAAINEIPNLDDYTQLQEIAGERWPEVRKRVLRRLRKVDDYISSEKVEILFREGLIPDALRMVDSIYEYDVAARVVDAATPTLPLEVIPICKRQAERIMDRAKADEYDRAVEWVAKARTAYGIAGKDDEWQAYKSHLLTTHSRKYKLVPMLREL
jgi:uncharacterized Zn finger protein